MRRFSSLFFSLVKVFNSWPETEVVCIEINDVDAMLIGNLKNVLKPYKRTSLYRKDSYVDIGYDCEYSSEADSADRELLSIQFSLGIGRSAIYHINKQYLSSAELLQYTLDFLKAQGVPAPSRIYLIAFFGIAELSRISDFYEKYYDDKVQRLVRPRLREHNRAVEWSRKVGSYKLAILDLYGFFPNESLEKVGESVGFKKISLEGIDGCSDLYWKRNMRLFRELHPAEYDSYSIRDAEVAVEAWHALQAEYDPFKVEIHTKLTAASLSLGVFRTKMTRGVCPTALQERLVHRRLKGEENQFKDFIVHEPVYAGSLDMRYLAALAYWGGNNQAFVRGYMKDFHGTHYDFKSLYPVSAILQPLSDENTVYRAITLDDVKNGAEGFCCVDFEFPASVKYPTLPIKVDYMPKLMFVSRGVSYCTASELRFALSLGVTIKAFRGIGFQPTESERDHDLKPYMLEQLKVKQDLEDAGRRDSISSKSAKMRMNSLVGKLAEMCPSINVLDISNFLNESSMTDEEFAEYGRKKAVKAMLERSRVGSNWTIEWASLILGRARALAGWAINSGTCLFLSTDGGLFLGDPKLEETEVGRELRATHSGIRVEYEVDEFFIAKNRFYIEWLNGARQHCARMSVKTDAEDRKKADARFEEIIRESLKAKKILYPNEVSTRLSSVNDFLYKRVALCSEVRSDKKVTWDHDFKRRLDRDIELFSGDFTTTSPWQTVDEAYYALNPKHKAGRRKTELTPEQVQLIVSNDDKTHAELALLLDVSESTVKRYRKKLN